MCNSESDKVSTSDAQEAEAGCEPGGHVNEALADGGEGRAQRGARLPGVLDEALEQHRRITWNRRPLLRYDDVLGTPTSAPKMG